MLKDRYDNPLTTSSGVARDAYVDGVDRLLAADIGAEQAFQRAIEADDGFALGHAALARAWQILAKGTEAAEAIMEAQALAPTTTRREQEHIAMLGHLVGGDGRAAHTAALAHLDDFPRDAVIAQPLSSVFGLIGFSGLPGREAEQLAFMSRLAPHYGDDWWFTTQFAFAQIEVGQAARAVQTIESVRHGYPRSANWAHVRSHIYYETGEAELGLRDLWDWLWDYPREGALHCHLSWHVALWRLELDDPEAAWRVIDADVRPGKAWGPPINVLTDTASFLHRAELAGGAHQPERWREVSEFAAQLFPKPGIAFADTHAALAHAMAGETEALDRLVAEPVGAAGEVVSSLAAAFKAFAAGHWAQTICLLSPIMSAHERIGGSRAQRDLIEYTLVAALLRGGRPNDARLMLATRRPIKMVSPALAGLAA
jgi:hypothetical protein